MFKTIAVAAMTMAMVTTAQAGCFYGSKNLPGSLGAGQSDNSRSFTVSGSARFIVRVRTGGPITANIGCGWRTSRYHSCRVYSNGETWVRLANNTGRQITYRWICRH